MQVILGDSHTCFGTAINFSCHWNEFEQNFGNHQKYAQDVQSNVSDELVMHRSPLTDL
jgi:hypothetical protein